MDWSKDPRARSTLLWKSTRGSTLTARALLALRAFSATGSRASPFPLARVGVMRATFSPARVRHTRPVFLSPIFSENLNLLPSPAPPSLSPFPLARHPPPRLHPSSSPPFSLPPFLLPLPDQPPQRPSHGRRPSLSLSVIPSSSLSPLPPGPGQTTRSSLSWPDLAISWLDLTDPELDLLPTPVYPPRNGLVAFLLANQLSGSSEKILETTCLGSPKQIFGLRTRDCEQDLPLLSMEVLPDDDDMFKSKKLKF